MSGTNTDQRSRPVAPAARPVITVRIKLDSPKDALINVHIGFRNDGPTAVWLWKRLSMKEGRMDTRRFHVTADGAPVRYLGPMTVRPEQTMEDFDALRPGQIVTSTIAISQYYAMPTKGRISVLFDAFNPSVPRQALVRLRSNVATLDIG